MSTIGGQNAVDAPSLSYGHDGSIDESQLQRVESRVEPQRPNNVGWEQGLILVPSSRIENLRDKLSHGRPVLAKKIIHLGQYECRHNDKIGGGQNMLVVRKGWFAVGSAGEGAQEATGIGHNRWNHSSRSRKSSDSSPSLVSVDSNRRVEGARRPV